MTQQPFVNKTLFLKKGRSLQDLGAIIRNEERKTQRVLLDVDGTLHKGPFEYFLRGITNAHLALYLLPTVPLSHLPKFISDSFEIFLYDRKTLANGVPVEEREYHTKYLVRLFSKSLEDIPTEMIQNSAKKIPKGIYPHAQETLQYIHGRRTLISCGIQTVVDAYGQKIYAEECFGNPLKIEDIKNHGFLYGAKDKERIAKEICAQSERAIVMGDTCDDLGMAYAAKEKNPENILIALHHRSEALEEQADIIAYSWQDLRAFIDVCYI